jgi:hypothetical protein
VAELTFIERAAELGIQITEAQAEIITGELATMTASMEATKQVFEIKLTNLIAGLNSRGLSEEQVINVLLDDLQNDGAIFGGLKRQLIGDAQSFAEVSSSRLDNEIIFEESGKEQMTWLAILVNTCEDCIARHGFTKSYQEWQELGLPATGWSICKFKCKCQLFPASVVDESKEELRLPLKRAKGKLTQIARDKKAEGQIKNVKKYVNRNLGTINDTKSPNRKEIRKVLPGFKR